MRSVSRLLLALATAGIVALAIVGFVTKTQDADEALRQRQDTANKAFARVNELLVKIDGLDAEIAGLQGSAVLNAGRIAELQTDVTALVEQVRRMGGQPIVASSQNRPGTAATTTTTVPPSPTQSSPGAQPQPPAPPNPPPACSTPVTVPVLGCVIKGAP